MRTGTSSGGCASNQSTPYEEITQKDPPLTKNNNNARKVHNLKKKAEYN